MFFTLHISRYPGGWFLTGLVGGIPVPVSSGQWYCVKNIIAGLVSVNDFKLF